MPDVSSYSTDIQAHLKKISVGVGDRLRVEKGGDVYEGLLMPKSQGAPGTLIIKLDNGYNIGIVVDADTKIKKIEAAWKEKESRRKPRPEKAREDKGKPTIAILATGGTIISRIDYKTGAVAPLDTPEELIEAVPELAGIANIKMRTIFKILSGDMEPEHWIIIAEKIAEEIESGVDGVIVTHGTDTMHYSSAALSLMLQQLPVPVLLVGSQRSSDRGSSDAAFNLICAAQFIAKSDFSGVAVCMHGSSSDEYCLVHQGTHVKKMHTSRRDTFRSIDVQPYAKVFPSGSIEWMRNDYAKKSRERKVHLVARFERKVALVKIHPAFDFTVLEHFEKQGYRGIVLEGTGLGNAPVNVLDDYTKHHPELLKTVKRMVDSGVVVGMTSQCAYGKVNMNVYSYGRLLLGAGVVPLEATPETAFVKLGWSLAHSRDAEKCKEILLKDVAGEFARRVDYEAFLQ